MHVGFVEHHVFTIAPGVNLTVDKDAAIIGIGGGQAQVITQGAAKRITMRIEVAAARQQREHGAFDTGNATDQFHGSRAQGFGGRQRFVIPLEIETLPALLEERAKTGVVVLCRRADIPLVEQVHRFVANHLPVVLEHIQFRELAAIQIRFRRYTGKQVHQGVIGCEQCRMVNELAQNRQTRIAA
ncbi:hypothetical protein D3C72_1302870 [compost metagenome]